MQGELFQDRGAKDVIDEIRPLPSDPNERRIRVNGRTVATLRAADVESLGLHAGQRWTKSLARRVAEAVDAAAARREAMKLLSRRAYSSADLRDRLLQRGHAAAIAKRIVDEAKRDGWLNEQALAEGIVAATSRNRPAGRRLIEERLRRKQVDVTVAAEVVERAAAAQDSTRAAIDLARKRLATMRTTHPATIARRIAALLDRRGFEEDAIAAAIAALELPTNDDA